MTTCDWCDCPAAVETAWGDDFCSWCYNNAPMRGPCPQCSSSDVTPAGLPVAAVDDRPYDADAAAPSAASAPIAPVAALGNEAGPSSRLDAAGASFSPVVVIPPAATTGESLDDMLQALEWCVTRAYDDDSASRVVVGTAERALIVFGNVIKAVTL